MKRPHFRNSRIVIPALIATALLAPVLVVVAPPTPASAIEIDCGYSPGLKSWLDADGAAGVHCAGSRTPGSPPGTAGGGSTPGGSTSGGSAADCVPSLRNLPPWFMCDVNLHDHQTWSEQLVSVEPFIGAGVRRNYLGGKLRSELVIYTQTGPNAGYFVRYRLWQSGMEYGATYSSLSRCGSAFQFESRRAEPPAHRSEPGEIMVAPGIAMIPSAGELETRGSLTPVVARDDRYLLRLDLTNPPTAARATPAFVSFGFGFSFELDEVGAVPSGVVCSAVDRVEECTVPAIQPGQTKSIILSTSTKAGVAADVALPIVVSNIGFTTVLIDDPARPERKMYAPVTNAYLLLRPPGATTPATPSVPVCSSEEPPGPSVTPGASPQTVVGGVASKLAANCVNAGGLPMTATALHGTATVDAHGWVTYTSGAAYRGPDTVTVVATSPETGAVSGPATIEVQVVDPAHAVDDTFTVAAGRTTAPGANLLVNDTVPATGSWVVDLGTPPAHGTLDVDVRTGAFTYRPAAGFTGSDSFRYRLTGPDGSASNVATVTFTVG
ncbi:MAG: Ig-like domain-containing protein [Herbiconiux sp.]|nr:Ig-like domain-containing protein [Herbiconiux sp.]